MDKAGLQKAKKALGERVRQLRLEHSWSQEEFAFQTGLHRTYVGAVERGERNVSLENILRIAKALKLSASDLLSNL
jgi:transcriptional regulator with XRE-family HTH domain